MLIFFFFFFVNGNIYKILNNMSPKYLSDIIPSTTRRYSSRNANNIPLVRVNKNYFIDTFFPSMERT